MHGVLAGEVLDHEQLEVFHDRTSGLTGAVALHSTALGPAMGGLRLAAYGTLDELVADALRLARAMSYKSAAADLPLGGGKAVILDDGRWDGRRRERLAAFARVLERLGRRYVTAEDVGTTPEDMAAIAETSRHVAGLPAAAGGAGDPSPATARTVLAAIEAAAHDRLGVTSLRAVRVGVLGTGAVGSRLAALLAARGAELLVADLDAGRAAATARRTGATVVAPAALVGAELDVLAPCGLGGVLAAGIAAALRCRVVCGAANNQLADDAVADELAAAGVLYVPDFVANCGGIVHVGCEALGLPPAEAEARIAAAADRVADLLARARAATTTPLTLAKHDAELRLRAPDLEAVTP